MTEGRNNSGFSETQAPLSASLEPADRQPSILEVVWHRRWTVLAAVAACLAAGFVYLAKATPIYRSTSRLYVEKKGPIVISESEGAIMTQSKNYLYTQAELLKSIPIVSAALQKLDLRRFKTFAGVDNKLAYVQKSLLDVKVGSKDEIVSVACESPFPKEAPQIVNAVVDSYITYHARKKQSTAGKVLTILREEKLKREKELEATLKSIVEFKKENPVVALESNAGNLILQQLSQLYDALAKAMLEAIDAETTYEALKEVKDEPEKVRQLVNSEYQGLLGYQLYSDPRYFALEQEYRRTRRQIVEKLDLEREHLAELKKQYTEELPAVRLAAAKVKKLEEELTRLEEEQARDEREKAEREKKFVEACIAAAHRRYLNAKRKEAELLQEVEKQRKLAQEASVKQAEYAVLESEMRRAERLCDILDNRIKEINVVEDTGALNISILEVAKEPDSPVKPKRPQVMALALVLGLMLGIGLALLLEYMDQRLHSVDEVAAALGSPVLGVVPHAAGKTEPSQIGRWVHFRPKSHFAEAYRTIRTAVYFSVPGDQAKILLVTSPAPGDGKTTVASNLAIAMAQAGQKVILLDADFRKPRQHEVFEIPDGAGLSSVLVGKATLKDVIRTSAVKGLWILPCGQRPLNPAEMLNSKAFATVLEKLSKCYHRIVIDSPPVMAVADARILGAMAEVTLLVLRAEKSTRRATEEAREGLSSVGARIIGAVVNDVRRQRGRYGYYYGGYGYYAYDYEYGSDDDQRPRRKSDGTGKRQEVGRRPRSVGS